MVRDLIVSLRPRHWTKNFLVLAGLLFSKHWLDGVLAPRALAGLVVFCVISGSVYLLNDLADREADRLHPAKRHRPVAAGRIGPGVALAAVVILVVVALGLSFWLEIGFGWMSLAYLSLTTAYTFGLKAIPLLDVLALASGFVIRAVAGATVIGVSISLWLLLCTLLLALFLALAKRRHELLLLSGGPGGGAELHRPALSGYSSDLIDQLIAVVTSATLMAYSLYVILVNHDLRMVLTIPVVIYGLFRYLYLAYQMGDGGSPEESLLKDVPLAGSLLVWLGLVVSTIR